MGAKIEPRILLSLQEQLSSTDRDASIGDPTRTRPPEATDWPPRLHLTGSFEADSPASSIPVLICLLGTFQVLQHGQPVVIREGGKAEALLTSLALKPGASISREVLLDDLWPSTEAALAGQSLNSLIYSLHKGFGHALDGLPLIGRGGGGYHLNLKEGVTVDTIRFEAIAEEGQLQARAGNHAAATLRYRRAVEVYRGDLAVGNSLEAVITRERLRALYLRILARLADYYFDQADYPACLVHALKLVTHEPCREDAHRLAMRCYVRGGERAQALHQYRLCEHVLRTAFDARPEPATTSLFDQVRLDPSSV